MAERLLDHHSAPAAISFCHETCGREAMDRSTEEAIRNGEVKKIIACGAVQVPQVITQATVRPRIGEVALQIRHARGTPLLHRPRIVVDCDKPESVGQALGIHQVVKCRHDQPFGQVASGAKDHHGAGRCRQGTLDLQRAPWLGELIVLAYDRGHDPILSPRCRATAPHGHLRPSSSKAASTICSGSNPNLCCSSFSGAEAPKVFMPMTRPSAPTYRSQPSTDPCSTAMRAFTFAGSTSSRYDCGWCSKMSQEGIETIRERIPRDANTSCAATTSATSLPEPMRMISGGPPGASAMT